MEPTVVSLPWLDIAKLALGTGFVAALITQGIGWLRDWRKDVRSVNREATYLALRVAVTLERFAIECASAIGDNNIYRQSSGDIGRQVVKLPLLGSYPNNLDWKSIDPALAARALALRNELIMSQETIDAAFEIDIGQVISQCNIHAGLRGYRALRIAANLRRRYDLPAFDPSETSWDVKSLLKEEHDDELERRRVLGRPPTQPSNTEGR